MRRNKAPSQIREHGLPSEGSSDPLAVLHKPFKRPAPSTGGYNSNWQPSRRARTAVNYTEGDPEAATYRSDDPKPVVRRDPLAVLNQNFRVPFKHRNDGFVESFPALGMRKPVDFVPRPLHDPAGEFAIVLYDPTIDGVKKVTEEDIQSATEMTLSQSENDVEAVEEMSKRPKKLTLAEILGISTDKSKPKEYPDVPVVIDPKLAKILRPHQVEGVKFLYRATTGLINPKAHGCIMADEMGLGKTLQCIALLWTLLKQSPQGKGTIQKGIVVCPSSLVRNWASEFVKWLGEGAVVPYAVDGSQKPGELAAGLRQWAEAEGRQVTRPVLIISYDTLRRQVGAIADAEVGLLLADEGHKLKNGDSQTFTALNQLNVKRRVILSGTPIQNDLLEYFSLLNFSNPGLLGTKGEFRKNYEIPILRGRDADGTEKDAEVAQAKLQEMASIVSPLIIRRTNDILSKYLPVKYEHVVFCNLSAFQKALYIQFRTSKEAKQLLKGEKGGEGHSTLNAINILKKLCNHPDLLELPRQIEGCRKVFPEDYSPPDERNSRDREVYSHFSAKFLILERMLRSIHTETNDKIVLISNYTQTLDMIEKLCRQRRYGCLRLDGTMQINKRAKLVDQFNNPEGEEFIFLLSSKAGGCGLNLIGANRLILMDPDWNPAADQQALARVWRDGQKKDCFVYRLIATGTIEEKIFQRQSMKQSLSTCVVDEVQDVERHYSMSNLRELFAYDEATPCNTHDMYECKRCKGGKQYQRAPAMLYGDATTWNHFYKGTMGKIEDELLRQEEQHDDVSFVFQYISH
ncbi:DNA repair protein [Yarrowia sp. B02]|nr:DNA repair protein [Yarrowia sp. B02]